ncbi:hypothetical protein [Leptolyngbya sp. 'hensonii']|uniref:hypothetical protein n=1 Tax=Leptolyngbya sp. 'hensonii' TaxID=1922337 RepID=UPI00117CEB70|nr:hypothetical protein [Leptolyngbya sp. 'hensonii']
MTVALSFHGLAKRDMTMNPISLSKLYLQNRDQIHLALTLPRISSQADVNFLSKPHLQGLYPLNQQEIWIIEMPEILVLLVMLQLEIWASTGYGKIHISSQMVKQNKNQVILEAGTSHVGYLAEEDRNNAQSISHYLYKYWKYNCSS